MAADPYILGKTVKLFRFIPNQDPALQNFPIEGRVIDCSNGLVTVQVAGGSVSAWPVAMISWIDVIE